MSNLRAAIAFLTRIPTAADGPTNLAAAVPWFPLVGCLIGVVVGGIAAGLIQLVPAFVAAALAVLAGVLLTGAFHEDGLADVSDAFAGGWTPEQRLKILDDPLHGSYGVAALCGSIVVRIACVASLGQSAAVVFACLIAAHGMARATSVGLMLAVPVSRPDGLGADYARDLRPGTALWGVLGSVAVAALATGWWVLPLAAAAAIAAVAMGWLSRRKIGGITGDVLGAAEQIAECLILVTATGLATRHHLWWD